MSAIAELPRVVADTPYLSRKVEPNPQPVLVAEPPKKPRLGCAGLIRRGDQILLGKRNKEPNRGLWVLPGGGVEFGESFKSTLARELMEEAGIEVEVKELFDVFEVIKPNEHRVILYVNAEYRSGEPVASSDLSEVRFFDRRGLQTLSQQGLISPFVEQVLRAAALLPCEGGEDDAKHCA